MLRLSDLKRLLPERMRVFIRQARCKHTHTFYQDLPDADRRNYRGKSFGKRHRGGLCLEGCYLCGWVRVRDWQA